MSTRAADRRSRAADHPRLAPPYPPAPDWSEPPGARLIEENERLRTELTEVESRHSLLQADHAGLRKVHQRTTREATRLQAECNRLEDENRQLQALADHPARPSGAARGVHEETSPTVNHPETTVMNVMRRIKGVVTSRWGLPALALVALLARDPAVRGVAASAARAVSPSRWNDAGRDPADGYLAYARMVNARDAYERARESYNATADSLKGDALLEAQDALRAARQRFAAARAGFLPALRDACGRAGEPFPAEAAALVASLKDGTAGAARE